MVTPPTGGSPYPMTDVRVYRLRLRPMSGQLHWTISVAELLWVSWHCGWTVSTSSCASPSFFLRLSLQVLLRTLPNELLPSNLHVRVSLLSPQRQWHELFELRYLCPLRPSLSSSCTCPLWTRGHGSNDQDRQNSHPHWASIIVGETRNKHIYKSEWWKSFTKIKAG